MCGTLLVASKPSGNSRCHPEERQRRVGMKRRLDPTGIVVALVRATQPHALAVLSRGAHREASRHGDHRTRPTQTRDPAVSPAARRPHHPRAHRHLPRAVHAHLRRAGAGARPPRGQHRERVGGRAPRAARPPGDRRRPELRADVRHAHPAHQDRQARRAGADAGVCPRRLPPRVSALGGAGARAGGARRARHAGADAGAGDHADQDCQTTSQIPHFPTSEIPHPLAWRVVWKTGMWWR